MSCFATVSPHCWNTKTTKLSCVVCVRSNGAEFLLPHLFFPPQPAQGLSKSRYLCTTIKVYLFISSGIFTSASSTLCHAYQLSSDLFDTWEMPTLIQIACNCATCIELLTNIPSLYDEYVFCCMWIKWFKQTDALNVNDNMHVYSYVIDNSYAYVVIDICNEIN